MQVIGIDPGETTGICCIGIYMGQVDGIEICQCNAAAAVPVARAFTDDLETLWATEKFVVRSRAGRSATAKAGDTTRLVIGRMQALAERRGQRMELRSASDVKPWATNERLKAAGITGVGGHSLDAARHALYAAVAAGYMKDPLSKR